MKDFLEEFLICVGHCSASEGQIRLVKEEGLLKAGVLLLLVVMARVPLSYAQPPETRSHVWSTRQVTLTVKVVFVGFDSTSLDMPYLRFNVPSQKFQLFLAPRVNTNVLFLFNYEYVFTGSEFKRRLVNFLSSIAKAERSWNPFFSTEVENTFYAAQEVEDWLYEHSSAFGGFPLNGYTLILMNLYGDLPSVTPQQYDPQMKGVKATPTPHYYNASFEDPDLGLTSEAKFMTSWGGKERLYFMDTSAGPSHKTSNLPLQVEAAVEEVDIRTAFGSRWLSQKLSELISASVHNLFASDFGYPLHFVPAYLAKVLIIDARGNATAIGHQQLVRAEIVKSELQSLLPFATLRVDVRFARIREFAELSKSVMRSMSKLESPSIVDLNSLYEWFHTSGPQHMGPVLTTVRDENQYDVPVIVLIFDGSTAFTTSSPEWLELKKPEGLKGACGIVAYDLAVLGIDSRQFSYGEDVHPRQGGRGFGLTKMVIQAIAVMVGLVPPFQYDLQHDFVFSVMARYPQVLSFSQFERDALLRGFADMLLMQAEGALAVARWMFANFESIAKARGAIRMAEAEYVQMRYFEAIRYASEATSHSSRIQGSITASTSLQDLLLVAGAGIALGSVGAYLLVRRRLLKPYARCPYCGVRLEWMSESRQWLCKRCGTIERKT